MIEYPEDESVRVNFIPLEEMEGLDFAIRYFDDNTTMYASKSLLESVEKGHQLKYYVLSYPKKQKGILEVVKQIQEELAKLPGGNLVVDARPPAPNTVVIPKPIS